ncbi:MAG: hypothetical protein LBR34_04420 [Prevotella sp.]|nr:hypothetical protein [Prevotella sp.]
MSTIELYINGQFCEVKAPESMGVRLNRILLNPAELNVKDARYSYAVSLPSTPQNDRIFGYANVEEVGNKFSGNYTAILIANGITVFDGLFRLTEITSSSYKGNLFVPASKTVKEIFGDKKMNEAGNGQQWNIYFRDMVSSMNSLNQDVGIPDCIFPFVLYGLLPKLPENTEDNSYTAKNVWDEYVRLGIENFPPSVNCLKTVRQLFEKNGCAISGNVFEDKRFANLYMSYQNPADYAQEWNWGHLGKASVSAQWSNRLVQTGADDDFEKFGFVNDDGSWRQYGVNLFACSMLHDLQISDNGANVLYYASSENLKDSGQTADCRHIRLTIPFSGLYKIRLEAVLELQMNTSEYPILPAAATDPDTGTVFISSENSSLNLFGTPKKANNFSNSRYEIKLLRDFGEGDFGLDSLQTDGELYENNLPQNKQASDVFYFPYPSAEAVQMIDPAQNEKLVCGFRWGDFGDTKDGSFFNSERSARNPLEYNSPATGYAFSRIMAAKNGWSWDKKYAQKQKNFSAIHNPQGYAKLRKPDADAEMDADETLINGFWVSPTDRFGMAVKAGDAGFMENEISNTPNVANIPNTKGCGSLSQVVWLEKGEHLTLVAISDAACTGTSGKGWMNQRIQFDLQIEPFKKTSDWLKADNEGNGVAEMNWNAPSDYAEDSIDLFRFLPAEMKADEWLDNFCKTFNLKLTQPSPNSFELNIVQTMQQAVYSVLDISDKASLCNRTNLPLDLPPVFEASFKINRDEQGYDASGEDGGGRLETGSQNGTSLSHTSGFSYNWYAEIFKNGIPQLFPVITNKEIWDTEKNDYAEMMKKSYTGYTQRFWYRSGALFDAGALWNNLGDACATEDKQLSLLLPILSNTFDSGGEQLHLNYKNRSNSLLHSFFSIIAANESHYTEVECYLSPEEYERLDGSTLAQFNSDLYYVASVEGYDPLGKNKTKLKLIRK